MGTKSNSFDDWTAQDIRYTFGIKETKESTFLTEWLSARTTPDAMAITFLEGKRKLLSRFFRNWNEGELKFRFIAQVVELASLIGENYNTFNKRKLTAVVNGITLQGRPELMIATGQEDPKKPYFFIHEYKPSKRADEPLGQVLSAMVAAQSLNADELPVMGCVVIGNIWQFLVLENNKYAISRTYDATEETHLHRIYSALCQAKVYIDARVN